VTISAPKEAAESGMESVPLKAKVGEPKQMPAKAASRNPKECKRSKWRWQHKVKEV